MNKITLTSIIIISVIFSTSSQIKLVNNNFNKNSNRFAFTTLSNKNNVNCNLLESSKFQSQETSYRKRRKKVENIIKLNLTNLFFLSPTVAYERVINNNMSIGSSILYSYFNWEYIGFKISGPRVFIDYKYYFLGTAPEGIYGLGYFTIGNLNLSIKNITAIDPITYEEFTFDAEAIFFSLTSGIGIGYQKVLSNNLTLDVYGGLGFGYSTLTLLSGSSDLFNTSTIPSGKRIGFNLGWAF